MAENHNVAAPAEVAAGTAEAAWNKVREQARALSGGRGIGELLSAVDEYGAACATRARTQAVPTESEYDTLQLYKDLQDLWAEANAVDTVIGRPDVLLAKITLMRDKLGRTTAAKGKEGGAA